MRRINRMYKFLIVLPVFLICAYLCFNFSVFHKIEFIGLLDNSYNFTNEQQDFILEREYIEKNQKITHSEINSVGAQTHTYNLSFENIPKNITTLTINLDPSKENHPYMDICLFTEKGNEIIFNQKKLFLNNDSKLVWMIGLDDLESAEINITFDIYGGSQLVNEEIISIDSVCVNSKDDIKTVKNRLFLLMIKSLLLTAVVFAVFYILFFTKVDNKLFKKIQPTEKSFFFVSLALGIWFSVLFPIFQIPDEATHFRMMYDELSWGEELFYQIGDFANTNRIIRNYNEKVILSDYFNFEVVLPWPENIGMPSIGIIKHFPQIIALIICTLLRTPVSIAMIVCEISSSLFYSFICYKALQLMPFKKDFMAVYMLLPICLQNIGTISYDAVLLPLCYLFIAYIMHLKFIKPTIKTSDVFILIFILASIALIKIPYAILALLLILIPLKKLDLNLCLFKLTGEFIKKHKLLFSVIFVLAVIIMSIPVLYVFSKNIYGKALIAAISTPRATLKLLFSTVKTYAISWAVQLTGDFGWFDTPVSEIFTFFVLINLIFIALWKTDSPKMETSNGALFKKYEIAFLWVIGIIGCFLICLSMLVWTLQATGVENYNNLNVAEFVYYIRNIPLIGGIQGRYFLPLLPMFLIPLNFKRVSEIFSKLNKKTYLVLYAVILVIYISVVLLNRYWLI